MLVKEVPGHPHGMTFGNIKFHLPIGLPLGKAVLNLNLNSLLVKRQIDNTSLGAVTGGN